VENMEDPPPTHTDPSDTMLRGLLRWVRERCLGALHLVGLSPRGNGSGSPLEGLPYGDTHSPYPSQTFPVKLPV
jgi:hypothetical protein